MNAYRIITNGKKFRIQWWTGFPFVWITVTHYTFYDCDAYTEFDSYDEAQKHIDLLKSCRAKEKWWVQNER